jgi:hypothetical protein
MALSVATLPDILGRSAQLWLGQNRQQYIARVDAVNAIRAQQTARIGEVGLADNKKDLTVKVGWLKGCDIVDQACTDDCAPVSVELTDDVKTYTLGLCREAKPFKVVENDLRDVIWTEEEAVASGLMIQAKTLDEYWAKMVYTKLATFAGVNAYASSLWTLAGTPTGSVSNIAAANVGLDLIPELHIAAYQNYMNNPLILSGSMLYNVKWKAIMDGANADGKGAQNRMETLNLFNDLQHADATVGAKAMWQIDQGSVAMVTKNRFVGVKETKVDTRFTYPSNNIPGLVYDVVWTQTCSGSSIVNVFKMTTYGDIFSNPLGCTANRTGVIKYAQV